MQAFCLLLVQAVDIILWRLLRNYSLLFFFAKKKKRSKKRKDFAYSFSCGNASHERQCCFSARTTKIPRRGEQAAAAAVRKIIFLRYIGGVRLSGEHAARRI